MTQRNDGEILTEISAELRKVVLEVSSRLERISDRDASQPPAPGKWCAKEILGHLIDSASNNHHRFVRTQQQAAMSFPAYEQEHWVSSQSYRDEPWLDIVRLWTSFNLHLAHVIRHINPAALENVCSMGTDEPSVLRDLIVDYGRHLKHHLSQIEDLVQPSQTVAR